MPDTMDKYCNLLRYAEEYEALAAKATDSTTREQWLLLAKEFRAIAGERLESVRKGCICRV